MRLRPSQSSRSDEPRCARPFCWLRKSCVKVSKKKEW